MATARGYLDQIETASLTVNRRNVVARMNHATFTAVQDEIQAIREAAGAPASTRSLTAQKVRFFDRPSETRLVIDNHVPGDTIYVEPEGSMATPRSTSGAAVAAPDVQAAVREAWAYLTDAMGNEAFNAPVRIQAAQAICQVYASDTEGLLWQLVEENRDGQPA